MNNADKAYLELLKEVRENGVIKSDRTGTGTISIFGRSLKFKMSEGFPLLTTKKIHTKSVIHELLWFLDGGHNIKYLVDNGVNIWNEWPWQNYMKEHENRKLQLTVSMKNADSYIGTAFEVSHMKQRLDEHPALTLEEFITKIKDSEISGKYSASKDSFADVWGELGPVYGKQWRQWQGWVQYEKTDGDYNGVGFGSVWHDQILKLIQDLKTNPDSRRLMVNAWNVAEIDSMLLPPCFLKDSYVCTKDAYKKIQDITMDDYILSHDGSFNKVDEIFKTEYSGDMLKIKPYYIPAFECTPNHPFLVKDKGYIEASKLSVSDFIGIPINTKSIIPEFEFIDYKTPFGINKNTVNKKILLDNLDYWYFMGYYLGDGWLNFKKREVFLSIANKDKIKVLPKLLNCFKLYEHRSSGINVKKYSAKNELFFNLLQEFGQYCDGKKIPEWVQDAPLEMINSFLEGYKDADGCEDHISIHVTTVSDSIAYSVQRLYLKLKKKCSISYSIKDKKRLLLGRLVNQKNSYLLTVQKDYKYTNNNFIFDADIFWTKLYSINQSFKKEYVYNFDVNSTHTYTVNNIINHNCHYGFQCWTRELTLDERSMIAGSNHNEISENIKSIGVDDDKNLHEHLDKLNVPRRTLSLMWQQRSVDLFLGLPFNIASYALLLEMLAQSCNMVADELIFNGGDCHIYTNHFNQVDEQLKREPMELCKLELTKPDSQYSSLHGNNGHIIEYKYENFKFVDYKSHPAIKAPIAI